MRALHRLADAHGICRSYISDWGDERAVSDETLTLLLGDEGQRPETALEAEQWRVGLPPVLVFEQGRPLETQVTLAEGTRPTLYWRLTLEDERERPLTGTFNSVGLPTSGSRNGMVRLPISIVPNGEVILGYHRLELSLAIDFSHPFGTMPVICVPTRAHLPAQLDRSWALTAQLYSLRSSRNWGIGDFSDLAAFSRSAAEQGASAVGLNPLHALFPCLPKQLSPYSPSSRSFLNPIYLDVEAVPEFLQCPEAQALVASPKLAAQREAARSAAEVDYPAVWHCKLQVLALLHRHFVRESLQPGKETTRGREFRRFQEEGGEPLRRFALFEVLQARFLSESDLRSWRAWPEPFRDPSSQAVTSFAESHREQVEQVQYLQWECERQLESAAAAARGAGMSLGIYRDVAVGVDPDGAEAWGDQALLMPGASIGAPPDIFNPNGQNWGLTPQNPRELYLRAYAPFIAAVRANMRHAGAIRMDHVIGLKRLWWIPRGKSSSEGAYVAYPLEDLLGIVALESVRNRCVVVGEDLGTVPKGFREELERRALLSYRILMFEREEKGTGDFISPQDYPLDAAVALSTHDLATLKGFWEGSDLALRRELKLFPSKESADEAVVFRDETRRCLLKALGLKADAERAYQELAIAAHRFLAKARSRLLLVQVEDLLGQREQMNMPGTVDEHPNWRRKLAVPIEQLFGEAAVKELLKALVAARR